MIALDLEKFFSTDESHFFQEMATQQMWSSYISIFMSGKRSHCFKKISLAFLMFLIGKPFFFSLKIQPQLQGTNTWPWAILKYITRTSSVKKKKKRGGGSNTEIIAIHSKRAHSLIQTRGNRWMTSQGDCWPVFSKYLIFDKMKWAKHALNNE